MYVFEEDTAGLHRWIREEVEFGGELSEGDKGPAVRRVQEWLSLNGYELVIDGHYGPVTTRSVSQFQQENLLADTGDVDGITFARLVSPMVDVLRQRLDQSVSLEDAVLTYANAHLQKRPVEVGGQNCGPWVRLYMRGNDGPQWAWCAGFVTFLLHQAADSLQVPLMYEGSFSCDSLAAQARAAGAFVSGSAAPQRNVPAGSIFLVRRTDADWTHTGIVTELGEAHFGTIEGNTNDDGNREGYEVCARSRGYSSKDFLRVSPLA